MVSSPRTSWIQLTIVFTGFLVASNNSLALAEDNLRWEVREVAKSFFFSLEAEELVAVAEIEPGKNPEPESARLNTSTDGRSPHPERTIHFGDFFMEKSDSRVRSASGAAIALVLAEELQRYNIHVRNEAHYRVEGKYVDVIDAKTRLLATQIRMELKKSSGRVLTRTSRGLFGNSAQAGLFGMSLDFPPTGEYDPRNAAMMDALDNPHVRIDRTLVLATDQSPYAMELLTRKGGLYVPQHPVLKDNQAWLSLNKEAEFAVRLHNATDHEAAVMVFIDGVSLFAFSNESRYSQVLIPPRSSAVVKGWFHGEKPLLIPFRFGTYPDNQHSAALPAKGRFGHVTAVFSRAYPRDEPLPEDEPPSAHVRQFSRSADTTGRELKLSNLDLVPEGAEPVGVQEDGPAIAEVPEARPLQFRENAVSADFRSKFEEHSRDFGIIRSAVTIHFTP